MNAPDCAALRPFLLLLLLAALPFFNQNNMTAQPAGFSDNLYLGGWDEVAGFTWDNNGRMYVWERKGKVWVVVNGGQTSQPPARHQR